MENFSPRRLTLWLIGLGLAARLLLAGSMGLGIDESYVVSIARTFSLSYFDHPPLHFWLVKFMALSTGSEQALWLRLPFIGLFAGSTWLMFRITARCFGDRAGFYAALLMNLSPVFSLSTGSWILPDGPLFFFLLAAVDRLITILFEAKKGPALLDWAVFGALIGLGLLSKYHTIFIPGGLGLFLLTTGRFRLLLTPGPYLAMLIAVGLFSPVLLWNAENGWASFVFQGSRGAFRGLFPEKLLTNLAGQALWLLPWIWAPLVWVFVKNLWQGPPKYFSDSQQMRYWFFCCLAAGPILLFTIASLWQVNEALLFHWQAPGYLLLFPLLGDVTAKALSRRPLRTRRWLRFSAALFLSLVFVAASHTATGWLQTLAPQWFAHGDPTLDALDWRELPDELRKQALIDPAVQFIAAPNWIDAGKVAYAMGGVLPVLCLNAKEPHHFSFISDHTLFRNQNALLIARKPIMDKAAPLYSAYFSSIRPVGTVRLHRNGAPALELAVYRAESYNGTFPLPYGYR